MKARALLLIAMVLTGGCRLSASQHPSHATVDTTARQRTQQTAMPPSAPQLYAHAEQLLDCAAYAASALDSVEMPPPAAFDDRDPTRIRPAPTVGTSPRRTCQGLGVGARIQARHLLREAANNGSTDARIALLDQDADELLDTLATRTHNSDAAQMSPTERSEAEQIITTLEQQAYRGNRRAITSLQQVLDSGVLASAEPYYASAWRLVAEQPAGHPLSPGPLQGEAMLDQLDAENRQQVIALARDLHAVCCAH